MKTDTIIPAIIPESYNDINDSVQLVEPFVKVVQIDLLDGLYTSNYSWPWDTKGRLSHSLTHYIDQGMPFWSTVDYEFDCMVVHPIQTIKKLIQLGPRRIVVHAKTLQNLESDIVYLQSLQPYIEIGIAFTIHDDISKYKEILSLFDYVQCMGIAHIGGQGQQLDEKVYTLITQVRALVPEKIIQIDGGVNADTIGELARAGANRFVSGSFVFDSGLVEDNITELENATY